MLQVLIFTGCATSIKLEVERPPNLNTAGIRRIAVMPFEIDHNNHTYRDMATYIATTATRRIRETEHFTLVDPSEIDRLQRNSQTIENHVDALLVGRITRIDITDRTQEGSYKTRDDQTVYFTDHIREVEIEFNYSLTRARDASLIGPVYKRGTNSVVSRNQTPSQSGTALLRPAVDRLLRTIGQDLAPHTVVETRRFAVDNSKNRALRTEMRDALAQVRSGNHRIALQAYLGIYERHKSLAAAENASILHEAFGDVQVAADFMRQVFDDTGNPKAREVLSRLNRILQDQATLASEYSDALGQTERVAAFASEEIRKILPDEALVWVYNNSPDDIRVEAVVDNINADLIRKGIGVVDRNQQNAALILAEQKLHMSGAVSDSDIVGIGNAAGANTIIVIGITGTGAMRRLQVRVLDIGRGIPLMQSDVSERWQL